MTVIMSKNAVHTLLVRLDWLTIKNENFLSLYHSTYLIYDLT